VFKHHLTENIRTRRMVEYHPEALQGKANSAARMFPEALA
jgi:hypothetical protein